MTGSIKFDPASNGYATLFKNASKSADYGTALEDIDANGAKMALTLNARTHTATLGDEHDNIYAIATATPTVTQLTPLNGFTKTENNVCRMSDCGAAKVVVAELKFSADVPGGTTILYTGISSSLSLVSASVFGVDGIEFLKQITVWHHYDGRLVIYAGLKFDADKGAYNMLHINATIGG